jgi:hypothetical protein
MKADGSSSHPSRTSEAVPDYPTKPVLASSPVSWNKAARNHPKAVIAADGTISIRNVAGADTIALATCSASHLHSRRYHLRTKAKWSGVEGRAYLEMWSRFPDGSAFFSRTLGDAGPMKYMTGTCTEWQEVLLPFDASGAKTAPDTLTVNLVMPGKGVVELQPLELVDAWPAGW